MSGQDEQAEANRAGQAVARSAGLVLEWGNLCARKLLIITSYFLFPECPSLVDGCFQLLAPDALSSFYDVGVVDRCIRRRRGKGCSYVTARPPPIKVEN